MIINPPPTAERSLENIAISLARIADELTRIGVSQGPCDGSYKHRIQGNGVRGYYCQLNMLHPGRHKSPDGHTWTDEEAEATSLAKEV